MKKEFVVVIILLILGAIGLSGLIILISDLIPDEWEFLVGIICWMIFSFLVYKSVFFFINRSRGTWISTFIWFIFLFWIFGLFFLSITFREPLDKKWEIIGNIVFYELVITAILTPILSLFFKKIRDCLHFIFIFLLFIMVMMSPVLSFIFLIISFLFFSFCFLIFCFFKYIQYIYGLYKKKMRKEIIYSMLIPGALIFGFPIYKFIDACYNPIRPTDAINATLTETLKGKYAFISRKNSLVMIDVSNPENPKKISCYDTRCRVGEIYVSGKYAYIANTYDGLKIIDISNPSLPKEVGWYDDNKDDHPLRKAETVYVLGNYAYVGYGFTGLTIIDVSNPTSPKKVANYHTPGIVGKIYVSGKYAYISDGATRELGIWSTILRKKSRTALRIIDISNLKLPKEIGHCYLSLDSPPNIYVLKNYVYSDEDVYLKIIDISNPSLPKKISCYGPPWWANETDEIYVSENYVYIADNNVGLKIIDISNPFSPKEVGCYDIQGEPRGIYVSGNYTYVVVEKNNSESTDKFGLEKLKIIDISNPSLPKEVGSCDIGDVDRSFQQREAYQKIYVSGDNLYGTQKDERDD